MIDLDHNATTPLCQAARTHLADILGGTWGNPSSTHGRGRATRELLEAARRRVAAAVGAKPLEVTFTSGGTEADNLAVLGAARRLRTRGRPSGVALSGLEHPAVLESAQRLRAQGHPIVAIANDSFGRITPQVVAQTVAEHPEVGLVTVSAANHEIGTLVPIPAVVQAVRAVRPEILVHCDAVQAFGKIPVHFAEWDVDLMSVSSHKVFGPPGAGALVHRQHLGLEALGCGGQQERGRRVGTEPWLAASGFSIAAAWVVETLAAHTAHLEELTAQLRRGIVALGGTITSGDAATTPNTTNVRFEAARGEMVAMNLDLEGYAVSTGAACSSGSVEASPVLLALGLAPLAAREAIRISVGPANTAADIQGLLEALVPVLARVRAVARRSAS